MLDVTPIYLDLAPVDFRQGVRSSIDGPFVTYIELTGKRRRWVVGRVWRQQV